MFAWPIAWQVSLTKDICSCWVIVAVLQLSIAVCWFRMKTTTYCCIVTKCLPTSTIRQWPLSVPNRVGRCTATAYPTLISKSCPASSTTTIPRYALVTLPYVCKKIFPTQWPWSLMVIFSAALMQWWTSCWVMANSWTHRDLPTTHWKIPCCWTGSRWHRNLCTGTIKVGQWAHWYSSIPAAKN